MKTVKRTLSPFTLALVCKQAYQALRKEPPARDGEETHGPEKPRGSLQAAARPNAWPVDPTSALERPKHVWLRDASRLRGTPRVWEARGAGEGPNLHVGGTGCENRKGF